MKIRNVNRLTTAISVILLAGSQVGMVQAADEDYSGIAAPPKFTPSSGSYPPPPPGGWDSVVENIDKKIESDIQQTQSGRPAGPAPVAGSGTQFGGAPGFPQFQDPPEWGQREMPQPPEWAGRGMPAAPAAAAAPSWPEPGTTSQPEWAQSQQPGGGGSRYAPPEWGGGPMPEPPEWGDRSIPQPPEWTRGEMPETPKRGDRSEPEPPAWAGRNIPTPSDWGRVPSYPPQRYDRGRGYRAPAPWDSRRGPGYRDPWDSRRRGRGDDFSPFGSSGPSFDAPWDSGRGGRSMPWSRGKKGKGGWMDKDWFADSWDDMLNAPADMGEMPGGWYAPTISVPNPVDVGDEFGTAAEDMPTQMRNVYDDNRRYNSRSGGYDRYDRYRR